MVYRSYWDVWRQLKLKHNTTRVFVRLRKYMEHKKRMARINIEVSWGKIIDLKCARFFWGDYLSCVDLLRTIRQF